MQRLQGVEISFINSSSYQLDPLPKSLNDLAAMPAIKGGVSSESFEVGIGIFDLHRPWKIIAAQKYSQYRYYT